MANPLRTIIESDKGKLRRLGRLADKVEAHADEMAALSDEELQAKTPYFRDLLKQGQTLDDILPEAFAVVREGAKRVWGYTHSVSKLWFCSPPRCNIAEMKTGEGKTLTGPWLFI